MRRRFTRIKGLAWVRDSGDILSYRALAGATGDARRALRTERDRQFRSRMRRLARLARAK